VRVRAALAQIVALAVLALDAAPPARAAVDLPLSNTEDSEPGLALDPDAVEVAPLVPPPAPPAPPSPAATPTLATATPARADDRDFPLPERLRPAVEFWKRVYLEAGTDGGYLHDADYLQVVLSRVEFGGVRGDRQRERIVDQERRRWRVALDDLRRGVVRGEDGAHALRLYRHALHREPEPRDFALARERIRFQLGQRDKFRAGLIRSGAYEAAMKDVFRGQGLPEDLAYLPHVESSFNVHAYSKYGAAGPWQFMRSTGRRFLRIDYVVDERLDPMKSTRAAARLLRENYAVLGNWPLALTAYNHGTGGMARAKRQLGTDRIDVIIEGYRSRSFGFASRNFYAQFLAARAILNRWPSHFVGVQRDEPQPVDELLLPFYADVRTLQAKYGIAPEVVRELNPALRPPVFKSGKRIPRGYALRLPAGTIGSDPSTFLARVPAEERHADQHHNAYYQVRRGDSLSRIAARHRVSVGALVAANDLSMRSRIFPGQVLTIPGRGEAPPPADSVLVATANAATLAAARPPEPAAVPAPAPIPEPTPPPVVVAAAEPATPVAQPVVEPVVEAAAEPAVEPAPEPALEAVSEIASLPADEPLVESVAALVSEPESEAPLALVTPPAETAPASAATEGSSAIPEMAVDSPWRRIDGNSVMVDSLETLGHYADWLEVPVGKLRKLNKLTPKRRLQLGQRVRLDFSKVSAETFLERRIEYHKSVEEDFFAGWRVTGTESHQLRKGESLWLISRKKGVPIWLIHRFNPDVDLTRLIPGTELELPLVEKLGAS
jgi:membrane-bound lytic murein transglycosylase D